VVLSEAGIILSFDSYAWR